MPSMESQPIKSILKRKVNRKSKKRMVASIFFLTLINLFYVCLMYYQEPHSTVTKGTKKRVSTSIYFCYTLKFTEWIQSSSSVTG